MISEIPINTTETEQQELNNRLYDRVVEILQYRQENPKEDFNAWEEEEDLIYLNIESENEEDTITDISICQLGKTDDLHVTVGYILSKIPIRALKRVELEDYKNYSFNLTDPEKKQTIRALNGVTPGMATFGVNVEEPTEEELKKFCQNIAVILTPSEKRLLERATGYKL
jgi:hypothetical protein